MWVEGCGSVPCILNSIQNGFKKGAICIKGHMLNFILQTSKGQHINRVTAVNSWCAGLGAWSTGVVLSLAFGCQQVFRPTKG